MSDKLATTVHTAAMPSQLRTMVKKWYTSNVVEGDAATMVKLHASAAAEGVRATGESAVMGSLLGAFHAVNKTGLDVTVPGTSHKVPVDAIGALLGLAGGVAAASAPHGMGKTVANAGAACAAVYGFRQVNDLIAKLKAKQSGATPGGGAAPGSVTISKASFGGEGGWADGSRGRFHGEDPVLAAARRA